MNMTITYGSICSGIEAATVAWHPLGWRAEWFAEIEPFPSAVLAYRWPEVSNLGDMTKLARQVLAGSIAAPEVLVGGTPCQAFSVAGMRAGLDDPRGQLTIKYVELADAVDHVRTARGEPECIVVWENVPGVLSDKGNAFGCFLGALVGESDALQPSGGKWTDAGCVYGPVRTAAWRVLDAQYFGLAQRRRRVFVVASARAGFDPAAVLFESEGVRRDTAPRRGEGENPTGTIAGGARRNGGYSTDDIPLTAATITANYGKDGGARAGNDCQPVNLIVAGTLQANGKAASSATQQDAESGLLVVHGTQDPCVDDHIAHTLGRNHGQENAIFAIQNATRGKDQNGLGIAADSPMYTLDQASQHAVFAIQAGALRTNPLSGPDGVGVQADHAYTLEARAEVQAVAVALRGRDGGATAELGDEVQNCLRASNGGGDKSHVMISSGVRRLTPIECERLQGFPDNWTQIPWRGKPAEECPDGPRYKAIGNSKAVPVVRWIGRRIQRELERAQ
jgi:DNA (cytosine-5)-methyltransferase 1